MKYLVSMLPLVSITAAVGHFIEGHIAKAVLAIVLTLIYSAIVAMVWIGESETNTNTNK